MLDKKSSIELYKKYFREESDHSVTFLGSKLNMIFPKEYIKKDIASINNKQVHILGIFEAYIYDDINKDIEENPNDYSHHFALKCPAILTVNPPSIEEFSIVIDDQITAEKYKESYYKLTFYYGDTFINNTVAVQSINVLKNFSNMIFSGHIPSLLTYSDVLETWDLCNRSNGGGDLKVDYAMLAIIVSALTRCPDDYTIPFRFKYEKYREKGILNGKIVRMNDVPKYSSDFASLTGADAKHGITIAMKNRRVDNKDVTVTPVEDVIK